MYYLPAIIGNCCFFHGWQKSLWAFCFYYQVSNSDMYFHIDKSILPISLHWRDNGRDGFSHHQSRDCLVSRLVRRRWKKTSKLRVTGICAGNSPVTGEFPAQMASYAENVSIWWRHHILECRGDFTLIGLSYESPSDVSLKTICEWLVGLSIRICTAKYSETVYTFYVGRPL